MKKIFTILGIDPGYGRTGWGVINSEGSRINLVGYGCIETSADHKFVDRLEMLYSDLQKIIKKYRPDLVAVEDLFFYKNVKTAIKVGQARGVIILAARLANLPVAEFTPLQ